MIIRPGEVHEDSGKARLGVGLACEALGIQFDLRLSSMWLVTDGGDNLYLDKDQFLELAREAAVNGEI